MVRFRTRPVNINLDPFCTDSYHARMPLTATPTPAALPDVFRELIKREMDRRGMTARDVAEKSGTPYNKAAYEAEAKREAEALAKKQQSQPAAAPAAPALVAPAKP